MMMMVMTITLHYTDQLFNSHEYHNTSQHVQPNKHLCTVVMAVLMSSVVTMVLVGVVMVTMPLTVVGVVMGVECMGY